MENRSDLAFPQICTLENGVLENTCCPLPYCPSLSLWFICNPNFPHLFNLFLEFLESIIELGEIQSKSYYCTMQHC